MCADGAELSSGLTVEVGETTAVADGATEILIAECADGQIAISGSVNPGDELEVSLVTAAAVATFTVTNNTGDDVAVTPYVICAEV
ncbi:hypothetical protein BH23ACT5_BH23ACT5_06680 [soil metagenome]